jgi:hypothetical protein
MPLIHGELYTRARIKRELGVLVNSFLPHQKLKVVCACLTIRKNPRAPHEIFAGNSGDRMRWAGQLWEQRAEPIPVFIKEKTDCWRYVGKWYAVHRSENPGALVLLCYKV